MIILKSIFYFLCLAIHLFIIVFDKVVSICVVTNDKEKILTYLLLHNHFLSMNLVSLTSRSRLGKKKQGCNWKGILKIVQKAVFISISYPFSNFWFISNLYLPWYSTFCPNFSKKWSYLVHVRQGSPANYDEQRRTMTNNGEQWRTMTNNDEQWRGNVWGGT